MNTTTTSAFIQTKSVFNGLCQEYFKKNIDNIKKFREFLDISKPELIELLNKTVQNSPVKYNIKLEATYNISNTEIKENRAFKTSSRSLFQVDNINEMLEANFLKLLEEKEEMTNKGSGFSLNSIDGLIININRYKPIGGSSYLPLPTYIENKKATINVQNIDNKCFKYSIMANHVNPVHAERIGSNYTEVEDKYDFSNLNFPVMIKDIKQFERLNNWSVNVYSIKRGEITYKNNVKKLSKKKNNQKLLNQYTIFPIKVCRNELEDHHDLLLFGDGSGKDHYCRITNLSKLIGAQIS